VVSSSRRRHEHGHRDREALHDPIEQAALLPTVTTLAPQSDQDVIGRERADRILEGEERIIRAQPAARRRSEFVHLPSTVRSRASACSVALSVSDASHCSRPGNVGATTRICAAASISDRIPNGSSSALSAASPATTSSFGPMSWALPGRGRVRPAPRADRSSRVEDPDMHTQVEQVTDVVAYHGEGPVWSPRWGGLQWVDMLAGDVLALAADGSVERHHVGRVAAALRPRRGGGAVIGVERGFALEAPDGSVQPLPEVWSDPSVRMNEGGCDPDGRFYCGSMAYDQRPGAAALYRLDPDGRVQVVLEGLTVSNGLEWSPDGTLAYHNDTATHSIAVYRYDREAGLTDRRVLAALEYRPDGLTVDAEGGVWTALADGGAVRRYSPEGDLDAVIELPARKVTACTFGGERLDELFITTSREGLQPGEDPLAGALFRAAPGVRGLPVREFAG
jgi:sugar lactone lactonase YvrE